MLTHENAEGPELLAWFQNMPAFMVDEGRVNINDLVHSWRNPGTIIRCRGFDGPPIVALVPGQEKWYPIEDEL